MSQDNSNNVIQFPGRKKDAEAKPDAAPAPESTSTSTAGPKPARAKRKSKKTLAGTVLAVMLATGAVNRFVFSNANTANFTSFAANDERVQRSLASLESLNWSRNAKWEKQLAEELASPTVREIASTRIGRAPTKEEKLRWGILNEEKYTINYVPDTRRIYSILLQDETAVDPSYVLDREQFLKEFGSLFENDFKAAKLKSVESNQEKTVESYTIFNTQDRATGEARFELDRHKRLISLKVEPAQI